VEITTEIFYRLQSQAQIDYNEVNTKKIKRKLLLEIKTSIDLLRGI
jgi:hypothetical protein